MSELLIEASGLHTYYGSHHILHGVGFRIARGEAIGLMGRNGVSAISLPALSYSFRTARLSSGSITSRSPCVLLYVYLVTLPAWSVTEARFPFGA